MTSIEYSGGSDVDDVLDSDGHIDHEKQLVAGDPVSDFLMKMPPSWEKAEGHGKANLVVDASKTEVNATDKNFCICCHLPYPEDKHFYSVCCDNKELGDMGPGYPLLLEFIKRVGILLFILTIIYFLPVAGMIYDAYRRLDPDFDDHTNRIGIFSTGVFVKNLTTTSYVD